MVSQALGPTSAPASEARVVLIDDCFTTYNDPEVGIAAVRVLEAAGYQVELAGLACCGRPAISKGLLPLARELAAANVRKLAAIRTPGRSDRRLRAELPGHARRRISRIPPGTRCRAGATASVTVDAFVADPASVPDLPLSARPGRVLVHGHCQQKAVIGTAGTLAALRRVPGARGQRARLGLLRHGRVFWLRAGPLRSE